MSQPYFGLVIGLFATWGAAVVVALLYARAKRKEELEMYSDCDCFECQPDEWDEYTPY